MTTPMDVVTEARSWIGTAYQHQASLKGVAVDCAGLIVGVGRALNLIPQDIDMLAPQFRGYGRLAHPTMILNACDRFLEKKARPLGLGDVLVMRFEKDPQHLGIVTAIDPPYMVHSQAMISYKVTEHRLDPQWLSRIVAVYRFKGLE